MLTLAFCYDKEEDVRDSQKLIQSANRFFNENLKIYLIQLSETEADNLFNNPLLFKLFFIRPEFQMKLLNSRGADVFELVESLRKGFTENTHNWPGLRFNKLIPDKTNQKVLKMWSIISEGLDSPLLWDKIKINLATQDPESSRVAKQWGK